MIIRTLIRNEIEDIRKINRFEIVDQIYYYKNNQLILENEFYEISGWNPEEIEKKISYLYELYDKDGIFYGAFKEEEMIGMAVLESSFIGEGKDQLQVAFLHVDKSHRGKGLGQKLMENIKMKALKMGAKKLYISATPSKHTVDFYMNIGCILATEINSELFQLEPEDIHLKMLIE